jgi:hypothetical protein
MSFIGGVWLMLLGVLGAANLIIVRRPDARGLIDRLAPYQGWIGALSVLWGVVEVLGALLEAAVVAMRPLAWLVWLADGLLLVSLGLLLGAGVIKSFVSSPPTQQRIDRAILRLAPYQGGLGLAAIVVGLWGVLASVYYRL